MGTSVASLNDTAHTLPPVSQDGPTVEESIASKVVRLAGTGKRCSMLEVVRACNACTGPLFAVRMSPQGPGDFHIDVIFVEATHANAFVAKYPEGHAKIGSVDLKVIPGNVSGVMDISGTKSYGVSGIFGIKTPICNIKTTRPIPDEQLEDGPNQLLLVRDGPSLDDGPVYSHITEEQLISAILSGQAPAEVFGPDLTKNELVEVEVSTFKDQDWTAPALRARQAGAVVQGRFFDIGDGSEETNDLRADCTGILEAAHLVEGVPQRPACGQLTIDFIDELANGKVDNSDNQTELPWMSHFTISESELLYGYQQNQKSKDRWLPITRPGRYEHTTMQARPYKYLSSAGLLTHPLFWEMYEDTTKMIERLHNESRAQKAFIKAQTSAGLPLPTDLPNVSWLPGDWFCWGCDERMMCKNPECTGCGRCTRWKGLIADNQDKFNVAMEGLQIDPVDEAKNAALYAAKHHIPLTDPDHEAEKATQSK